METETIIKNMLTENTGIAMCDSGGSPSYNKEGNYTGSSSGYGRHYERNAGRDFDNELARVLSFEHEEISYTQNLYHYLIEKLDYAEDMDKHLHGIAKLEDKKNDSWHDIIEAFLEDLDGDVTGLYNEGSPISEYTYNCENNLSQDVVYTLFTFEDTTYVVLQIHNGCDARGGFTVPRVFEADEGWFNFSDGSIYCEGGHNWYTDDAYHWYFDADISDTESNLEDYMMEETELSPIDTVAMIQSKVNADIDDPKQMMLPGETQRTREDITLDTLYIDTEGNGYCPVCGEKLQ